MGNGGGHRRVFKVITLLLTGIVAGCTAIDQKSSPAPAGAIVILGPRIFQRCECLALIDTSAPDVVKACYAPPFPYLKQTDIDNCKAPYKAPCTSAAHVCAEASSMRTPGEQKPEEIVILSVRYVSAGKCTAKKDTSAADPLVKCYAPPFPAPDGQPPTEVDIDYCRYPYTGPCAQN